MRLKIKVRPEDFIVKEAATLALVKKGSFGVYLLEKYGWNTIELLLGLSRKLNLPFKSFSYGGRKDRHALTSQYIGIKGPRQADIKEKNFCLSFVGFMERPMGPDLIEANRFEITVRNLTPENVGKATAELETVKQYGFPNYFDDQRFGSFDKEQGFIAEKIIKKQFNGALKIYLTGIYPGQKQEDRERKQYFFSHWRNWELCLKSAKTKFEKKALGILKENPKGFLMLLQKIPRDQLALFFSSYQSYIWNEVLRRIIKRGAVSLSGYAGAVGDYIFYREPEKEFFEFLKSLEIPCPASNPNIPDCIREIYAEVLKENGLKRSMFNIRQIRQAFFKPVNRKAVVFPAEISSCVLDDEAYPARKKLMLKFRLPSGSFGTMLLKRLFGSVIAENIP